MQTVITIAIVAALSLIVVLGLLNVLKDLLDRFVESPLMSEGHADLGDELPAATAKSSIVDSVAALLHSNRAQSR
jgi:hypothetical protein